MGIRKIEHLISRRKIRQFTVDASMPLGIYEQILGFTDWYKQDRSQINIPLTIGFMQQHGSKNAFKMHIAQTSFHFAGRVLILCFRSHKTDIHSIIS